VKENQNDEIMKSLIVFYIPSDSVPITRKGIKRMVKGFKRNKIKGSRVIVIEDPAIEKVKTEVFFNLYQK
jgi:hypothetical protein